MPDRAARLRFFALCNLIFRTMQNLWSKHRRRGSDGVKARPAKSLSSNMILLVLLSSAHRGAMWHASCSNLPIGKYPREGNKFLIPIVERG